MANTFNLFISHSWAYSNAYEKLCSLLGGRTYVGYKNASVPKNDPIHNTPYNYQLYDAIKRKVQSSHVVLIMTGLYSFYSKRTDKEIQIARIEFTYCKPIIAIQPWGAKKHFRRLNIQPIILLVGILNQLYLLFVNWYKQCL